MANQKSFTIIELLVVIAVIGLISSIVLVSLDLPGQRKKAKIVRSLEFSLSIQNVLGSEGVGTWSFDEGSGTIAKDGSGYGNNGVIFGASFTDDTPHKVVGAGTGRYALSFDGTDDYLDVGSLTNVGNEITISMWLKPNSFGGILFSADQGNNDLGIFTSAAELFFRTSSLTSYHNLAVAPNPLTLNAWNFLTVTRDSSGLKKIYLNGVEIASGNGSTNWKTTVASAKIGARNSLQAGLFFNGLIDEVRIYGQALSQAEIQKHYTEWLGKYKLAEK